MGVISVNRPLIALSRARVQGPCMIWISPDQCSETNLLNCYG